MHNTHTITSHLKRRRLVDIIDQSGHDLRLVGTTKQNERKPETDITNKHYQPNMLNSVYINSQIPTLSLLVYSDTVQMGWEEKFVPVLINKAPLHKDIWESGSRAPHFLK